MPDQMQYFEYSMSLQHTEVTERVTVVSYAIRPAILEAQNAFAVRHDCLPEEVEVIGGVDFAPAREQIQEALTSLYHA